MTKSEYIALLEKEFKEMDDEFSGIVAFLRDEKYKEYELLKPFATLIEGIRLRFKHHDDVIINIIQSSKFGKD